MNTCSTCRWWLCYLRPVNEALRYYGNCKYAEMHDGLIRQDTRAYAQAIKCYDVASSATLQTSPDFGCNQWEGKDGNA